LFEKTKKKTKKGGFRTASDNRDIAGRKIFINNLPFSTSWQDLKDTFKSCGEIIRADVLTGYDGRSKGQGTVLFEESDAAQRAIDQFNGTDFDGRVVTVREYKVDN